MKKSKKTVREIVRYFRELSIIIAGIAITVGIGFWVNNNNSQKDLQQYLDAVILELNENIENFDNYAKGLQKSIRYSNYLICTKEKLWNKDSIDYYAYDNKDGFGWGNHTPVILYKKDAFEMFKFSGTMRLLEDKELLLSIWRVYHEMESVQNMIDGNLEYKKDEALRDRQKIDNGEPIVARLRWFYINNVPKIMAIKCESASEFIRETISKLEK
ncbi:MAG: hypothetical protein FWC10_05040 [Lentimicrobiaceae bacterium]|nr:hypothetical protein [Lentimicrobiaceae bacterium]